MMSHTCVEAVARQPAKVSATEHWILEIYWRLLQMAKEKQPRSPAAKRTVKKKNETVNPNVPITEELVSTAEPTSATARNAVIQGNSLPDSDEIRRRAYELYEQAGRPEGQQDEFWYKAEREIRSRNEKKTA